MLETESVVTFSEAAGRLPRFGGKRVHVSTIWRWARKGVNGRRLEVIRMGRRFLTSVEALDRFASALAAIELPERPAPRRRERVETPTRRTKSVEAARKSLKRSGI